LPWGDPEKRVLIRVIFLFYGENPGIKIFYSLYVGDIIMDFIPGTFLARQNQKPN